MNVPDNVRIKKSTGKLSIAAPGESRYLRYLRPLVADLARQIGFAETETAQIEMAVDEACANVVEHSYAPGKQWCWQHRAPEIRIEIRTEDQRLVIEINDHGQGFDFANYRPVALADRIQSMAQGGYGLEIMRQFMDEVQYNSNDQTGHTLRLVKYLKKS